MQNETEAQRIEREIKEYLERVPQVPDVLGVL